MLQEKLPHAIGNLCYYAVTPGGEMGKSGRIVIDISDSVDSWRQLMERHASQLKTRRYLELQLARARALGLEIGVEYAQSIWPNDNLVLRSLNELPETARQF